MLLYTSQLFKFTSFGTNFHKEFALSWIFIQNLYNGSTKLGFDFQSLVWKGRKVNKFFKIGLVRVWVQNFTISRNGSRSKFSCTICITKHDDIYVLWLIVQYNLTFCNINHFSSFLCTLLISRFVTLLIIFSISPLIPILCSSFELCIIFFSYQIRQHPNSFSSPCWFSLFSSFYDSL